MKLQIHAMTETVDKLCNFLEKLINKYDFTNK